MEQSGYPDSSTSALYCYLLVFLPLVDQQEHGAEQKADQNTGHILRDDEQQHEHVEPDAEDQRHVSPPYCLEVVYSLQIIGVSQAR